MANVMRIGELDANCWHPKYFTHRRLYPSGKNQLARSELFDAGMDDGDFPQADSVSRYARSLFNEVLPNQRHALTASIGVLVGQGSVAAHDDGTPGWTIFALTWVQGGDAVGVLQVGTEHIRIGIGEVIAFRANVLHSWVCKKPWTAVFEDLEYEE